MLKTAWIFVAALFLLTACPIGLNYSLGEPGTEKIDQLLIGTWECDNKDSEISIIQFLPRDKYSLTAKVLEHGLSFAAEDEEFVVYQTVLEGQLFLIFKGSGDSDWYHYHYRLDGDKIVFHDVSLLLGGVEAVTSTRSLREEVSQSMQMEGWGSEKNELHRIN